MQSENKDAWGAQDFIDEPAPITVDDDPWDPLSLLDQSSPSAGASPLIADTITEQSPPTPVPGERGELSRMAETQATFSSSASMEEDASDLPPDWFEDDFSTDQVTESTQDPIPTLEFDSELGEELYTGTEFINLTDVDIRLDRFLSSVTQSGDQDRLVRARLKNFSKARLSNWLPWLTSKAWTGRTLLLFMQFHYYWESIPEWWESRRYHRTYGWQPVKSPMSNILSRDDAYRIVHRRGGLTPEEMIDPVWFEEWDYHLLWRHGFFSFAKFAKFRSALNDGEEWKSLILWRSAEEDLDSVFWRDRVIDWEALLIGGRFPDRGDNIPSYPHTSSLPRWYDIQDWYPKHEWHDNLGWNIVSVGTVESSNSPEMSQGPVWPFGGRNE